MNVSNLTDAQRVTLREAINEAVRTKGEIEAKQDYIKDIGKSIKESLDVSLAEFNQVVTTVYKNNLDEQMEELNQLEFNIDTLFGVVQHDNEDGEDDLPDDYEVN